MKAMIAVWEFEDAKKLDANFRFVSCLQGKKMERGSSLS